MDTREIPPDVAASIKHCWPNGVVEEFSADESYFHEIRLRLERDLQSIRGASMLWQSGEEEISASCDDDQNDEPLSNEWQSYHVFFLSPDGQEFRSDDETDSMKEAEDPEQRSCQLSTNQSGNTSRSHPVPGQSH